MFFFLKRAALSAKEAKTISGASQRQSGQEELTAFFAETASDIATKRQPKVPVKGSILSFFKRASSPDPSTTAKTTSNDANSASQETLGESDSVKKPTKDKIEWQCTTCTFINKRKRSSYLPCEMCGELFAPGFGSPENSTPRVTPISVPPASRTRARTPQSIAPSKQCSRIHSTPMACSFRKKSSQQSPSEEVISIDETSNDSRKADKTRIAIPPETLVIIDSDDEASPRKVPLSQESLTNKAIKTQEVLVFSVSKNSGRITVHYKDDGSSSLTNFDVHDVLSENTVDALSDAQTTRADVLPSSIPIQFNSKAVEKGTSGDSVSFLRSPKSVSADPQTSFSHSKVGFCQSKMPK